MKTILTIFILFFAVTAFAQAPAIQWEKSYGGTYEDIAKSVQQTKDKGFVVAGFTYSIDGDVTGQRGAGDCWITKLDSIGNLQWERTYGGNAFDGALKIRTTSEGGYIFVATSYSNDGDITNHHGSTWYADVWVVKLDTDGNIMWQRSYGGTEAELAKDILQTSDGGYIVTASTWSTDGDVTGHHGTNGNYDFWVIKLDVAGNIQWNQCYGGSANEEPCGIVQINDSSYVVTGYSTSNDGDVTGHHGKVGAVPNVWVIKINKNGKPVGGKCLPGSQGLPQALCFSNEGGYMIAGICGSFPKHQIYEHGEGDVCVTKLSRRGVVDTVCAMGGSQEDNAYSIGQTHDGGYILASQTNSNDGDVTGAHSAPDYWVVKLDSTLRMSWEEALGGSEIDVPYSIEQTDDGGYVVAGESNSFNGNVSGNHGSLDFWIVKLAPDNQPATITTHEQAQLSENNSNHVSVYPNPARNEVNVSFPFSNNIIVIADLLGREMKRTEVRNGNSMLMNVGSMQDGVYILSIRDDKGNLVASEKLFKQ